MVTPVNHSPWHPQLVAPGAASVNCRGSSHGVRHEAAAESRREARMGRGGRCGVYKWCATQKWWCSY